MPMTDGPMGRDGKARTQQGSREEGVRRHVTDSSELCTSYPSLPYRTVEVLCRC